MRQYLLNINGSAGAYVAISAKSVVRRLEMTEDSSFPSGRSAIRYRSSATIVAMATKVASALECTCSRCGHVWIAIQLPTSCGKCKSKAWNNDARTREPSTPYVPQASSRPAHALGCRCLICRGLRA